MSSAVAATVEVGEWEDVDREEEGEDERHGRSCTRPGNQGVDSAARNRPLRYVHYTPRHPLLSVECRQEIMPATKVMT